MPKMMPHDKVGQPEAKVGPLRTLEYEIIQKDVGAEDNAPVTITLLQSPWIRDKELKRAALFGDSNLFLDEHGRVDWSPTGMGVYNPVFPDGSAAAKKVMHRPTTDVADVPADVVVTKEWKLMANFSDIDALFKKWRRMQKIINMFPDGKGLKKMVLWTSGACKEFAQTVNEGVKSLAAECESRKRQMSGDFDAFSTPLKKIKSEAATRKARDALSAAKEARESKRAIALG